MCCAAGMLKADLDEVTFDVSPGNTSTRSIRLQVADGTAASGERVAFKVMTNAPKRYRVKPTSGVLHPGEFAEVSLILSAQAGAQTPDWSKDKFLVKSVPVGRLSDAEVEELLKSTKSPQAGPSLRQTCTPIIISGQSKWQSK